MTSQLLAQLRNPVLPDFLGGAKNITDEYKRGGTVIGKFIGSLVGGFLIFAFVLAFFYLIVGGVRWLTSGGDKSALESARNQITHALLGLIIIAAAWAVMNLVGQFLGLFEFNEGFFKLPLPTLGGN